jgi:hypothetical protein
VAGRGDEWVLVLARGSGELHMSDSGSEPDLVLDGYGELLLARGVKEK